MSYDSWLTFNREAEEAEHRVEAEAGAWEEHCFLHPTLEPEASDPVHPLHAEQYEPWLASWWESLHEREI
jgi:hypothetical protein